MLVYIIQKLVIFFFLKYLSPVSTPTHHTMPDLYNAKCLYFSLVLMNTSTGIWHLVYHAKKFGVIIQEDALFTSELEQSVHGFISY